MSRKKNIRFLENINNPKIIQRGHILYEDIKGKWQDLYFKNENPLVLELGCGRGEYSTNLAKSFKDKNYVGIDIKGERLWYGAKIVQEENLQNVAFLRVIIQNIDNFFLENEVEKIWIPFPDPRPHQKDRHRRLTHRRFLQLYQKILKPKGQICFKTDDKVLFHFTLSELTHFKIDNLIVNYDYHNSNFESKPIITKYEVQFLVQDKKIKFLSFNFVQ